MKLIFSQLFYFVCAGALNNLLLRKDMCHWSKGMQIRYNLSHLEQWTRDMRLHEAGVTDTLAPIIQAAQLLQARKTDEDVNSVCDMCDKLSVSQVCETYIMIFAVDYTIYLRVILKVIYCIWFNKLVNELPIEYIIISDNQNSKPVYPCG